MKHHRHKIIDQFTDLPISRQRKWQLRMREKRRCTECGGVAISSHLCADHMIYRRELQRKYQKCKRRNYNSKSYQMFPKS